MNIPLTKTFTIQYTNPVDGKVLDGKFVTKKLSVMENVRVGVVKNKLVDGITYDPDTKTGLDEDYDAIANAIAHCKVALLEKPEWFDAENTPDLKLLFQVYSEVAAFEAAFFSKAGPMGHKAGGEEKKEAATV